VAGHRRVSRLQIRSGSFTSPADPDRCSRDCAAVDIQVIGRKAHPPATYPQRRREASLRIFVAFGMRPRKCDFRHAGGNDASHLWSSHHQHVAPIDLNHHVVSCNMTGNYPLEARGR
jgi:hypothetical protein